MIYFYSGTPGSGKSLHVARDIMSKLRRKEKNNVICNFPVSLDVVSGKGKDKLLGEFIYKDNAFLDHEFLINYAMKNHMPGVEGQTLVVIDECHVMFNPREFTRKDRMDWIKFFTIHRHLGYNFILVAQNDRQVDRQIRSLIEYETKHRKINNYKLGRLLPFPCFIAIDTWYGVNEKVSVSFFTFRKRISKLYDSYRTFEDIEMIFPNIKLDVQVSSEKIIENFTLLEDIIFDDL